MKTLKLHHPKTGHPFWDKDEYRIEMPDGTFFHLEDLPRHVLPQYAKTVLGWLKRYRLIIKPDGIYYQICNCSSGFGKTDYKEPFKIIDKAWYDRVVYVGQPLRMSQSLINDLKENGL